MYDTEQMIINKEVKLNDKNNLKNIRPYYKINELFISYKMEYYNNKNIFLPNNVIICAGKKFYCMTHNNQKLNINTITLLYYCKQISKSFK
jgi:hypothetical protein